jgi:hypothetical protein
MHARKSAEPGMFQSILNSLLGKPLDANPAGVPEVGQTD